MTTNKSFCKSAVMSTVLLAFAAVLSAGASAGERERLLGPFREKLRRVVFTKHFDMGGSHYAYTDAVSD